MATTKATNTQPTPNQPVIDENVETDALIVNTEQEIQDENSGLLTRSFDTQATIVKRLVANGAKIIKGLKVKNVNHSEQDNYDRITFSVDKGIRGYVRPDEDSDYELGLTNIVYSSTFAIAGAMKENEDLSWMANTVISNPTVTNVLFNGSTIDIIQIEVPAGEEYVNPFTTRQDAEINSYDEDKIFNHIIGFKLGKIGEKASERLLDKMMGF